MALLGLCLCGAARAQVPATTQGTEFYVSFMPNSSAPALKLLVSAKRSCTVTVRRSNGSVAETFTVAGGGIYTYIVSLGDAYHSAQGLAARSLRVTATDTISLYASNRIDYSADANNVLPTPALGSRYMVMSYAGISNLGGQKSTILMVATESGTRVKITPRVYRDSTSAASEVIIGERTGTAGTVDVDGYTFLPEYGSTLVHKRVRTAHRLSNGVWTTAIDTTFTYKLPAYGKPFTAPTMQAGQTYLYTSDYDLTGSIVEAEDCKKIAVFSGHQRTMVGSLLGNYSSDHLVEQMLPMHSLGKRFVMIPTVDRVKDRYRLLAAADGATVTVNGKRVLLNQGLFYENDLREPAYVEADKPMMVVMFPISVQSPEGNKSGSNVGDNSMIWVNPVEQNLEDIIFGALPTKQVSNHYVNVVVSTKAAALTTLNGQNIGARFAPVPHNPEYSYTRIGGIADSRAHYLRNPSGLAAYVYGYGSTEAYGYTAGSSVKDLSLGISTTGVSKEEQVMNFLLSGVTENMTIISWQFDNEPPIPFGSVDFPRAFDLAGCKDVRVRYLIVSDCGALEKVAHFPAVACIRPSDLSVSGSVEVCEGDTAVDMSLFKGSISGVGELRWYKDDTTQVFHTTAPISPFDVPGLLTYYVTQVRNEQESDRVPVSVLIKPRPTVSGVSDTTICKGMELTLSATSNGSITWSGEGSTWSSSAITVTPDTTAVYTVTAALPNGCVLRLPLTVTVSLKELPTLEVMNDTAVCLGQSVELVGSSSGRLTWNVQSPVTPTQSMTCVARAVLKGCKVFKTVNIYVNPPALGELTLTACDSATVNGITYAASGSYAQALTSAAGCDSILTVRLTVNKSTSGELALTVCDSVTVNGTAYFASGSYTQQLTNATGCDSTLAVYLTVNKSTSGELTLTGCDSATVNGVTYTASGSYAQMLANAAGCDSLLTIRFTARHEQIIVVADVEKCFGDSAFYLTAEAGSGLPVSFAALAYSGVVRVDSSGFTEIIGAGEVQVSAVQAGSSLYKPAAGTFTITVRKARQHITALPDLRKRYGDSDFTLEAASSSGLPVTFEVPYGNGVVALSGSVVHIEGEGRVTVTAAQPGNRNYMPTAYRFTIEVAAGYSAEEVLKMTKVYPNPTRGVSTIENEQLKMEEITLRDGAGNTIYDRPADGGAAQFDITDAPSGFYFLIIKTDKGTVVKRVMKVY